VRERGKAEVGRLFPSSSQIDPAVSLTRFDIGSEDDESVIFSVHVEIDGPTKPG